MIYHLFGRIVSAKIEGLGGKYERIFKLAVR